MHNLDYVFYMYKYIYMYYMYNHEIMGRLRSSRCEAILPSARRQRRASSAMLGTTSGSSGSSALGASLRL